MLKTVAEIEGRVHVGDCLEVAAEMVAAGVTVDADSPTWYTGRVEDGPARVAVRASIGTSDGRLSGSVLNSRDPMEGRPSSVPENIMAELPSDAELAILYRSGFNTGEIARQFDTTRATIRGRLKRHGVRFRSSKESKQLRREQGRPITFEGYWTGKKQPADMVARRIAKIRGPRHYGWKGGHERRPYRRMVKKTACADCGATEALVIHHRNDDHEDNRMGNLQVLCSPCHSRLHKTAYWRRRGDVH